MNEYSIEETLSQSSNSMTTSTSNLLMDVSVGGQNSLFLVRIDQPSKFYSMLFKSKEEKRAWKEALLSAKRKVKPDGQRTLKHFFELTNFGKEIVQCFVCNKCLAGLFYQGYKCSLCSSMAHYECLTKITQPCSNLSKGLPVSAPTRGLPLKLPPSPKPPATPLSTHLPQLAKAIRAYDGRPVPPETPALRFNRGETIQITDDDDDEWYKGFILTKGTPLSRFEGFFPAIYVEIVKAVPTTPSGETVERRHVLSNLDEYPWFSPVDRNMADLILSRVPNDIRKTIFMVRCRIETGGYAISIKHNGAIDHIKINEQLLTELGPSTGGRASNQSIYSIDQQHNFGSVQSLVNYYSASVLRDNFPQLDTTLGVAFRLALPMTVGIGTAMHDYNPNDNPHNTGEQIELKKGRKYFVLGKEPNGWWRVYNSDGLIGYVPGSYLTETLS